MYNFKPFDLMNAPLNGTNLIEASAGTGKTYTIVGLYLRLILEKHLTVDQILVVTFTKAATEELKQRIRTRLLEAQQAFAAGQSRDDMLDLMVRQNNDPVASLVRIKDAIRDFDLSAIFTIHGFCQRILHENAFETGSLFDTELVTDQQNFLISIADDFWRRMLYEASPEFVRYALLALKGPSYFLGLLEKSTGLGVRLVPEKERSEIDNLEPFRACSMALTQRWPEARETVKRLLMDTALNGTVYGSLKPDSRQPDFSRRQVKMRALVKAMDRFCSNEGLRFPLFEGFEKLTAAAIQRWTKKGQSVPEHPFFEWCDELHVVGTQLLSEMSDLLLSMKADLFVFAEKRLLFLKKSRNVQYFDDLLIQVKNALEQAGGNLLAAAIRRRYRAALVDEFQDTDMVQYTIFSRLFSDGNSLLFMIGDPKQAIYGFRGADIFSYMQASYKAQNRFTLLKNYRSHASLITAVNTLFSRVREPFVYAEIPFTKGSPGLNRNVRQCDADSPFKLWFIGSGKKKPLNTDEATQVVSAAVSGEISRLIDGPDRMNPGKIAVLVRTNLQAEIVKQHLSYIRVPAVIYSAGNVFETREAREMFLILLSIIEPFNEGHFRAALATRMLGVSGAALDMEDGEAEWWDTRLRRFMAYHSTWLAQGFIRMFSCLLSEEKVRARLTAFPDGERRLTNVLHLTELLHTCAVQRNLGMTGLVKWFSAQRDPASVMPETHQLRLESDARAVKIITIHKSKGLEFPVVFCPFGWGRSIIKGTDFTFHDLDADRRLTLDLGSPDIEDHRVLAQHELLAENLRLLYVALTRARERCYLAWGRVNSAETSALTYLLHDYDESEAHAGTHNLVQKMKHQFKSKDEETLFRDLKALEEESNGAVEVSRLPVFERLPITGDKADKEILSVRQFTGKIDRSWRISSYSSLISGRAPDNEQPDWDEHVYRSDTVKTAPEATAKREDYSIFSFPKGAAAGIFFHAIFEHLDFTAVDKDGRGKVVEKEMREHGFDPVWKDGILQMIERVLAVQLKPGIDHFSLSSISRNQRINEMEFYFPLKKISPDIIRQVFRAHKRGGPLSSLPEHLGRLHFAPAKGFMKGFIDLVFSSKGRYYLIDWKSNYLGPEIGNYRQELLNATMEQSFYGLQYHLYTLALHLYLKLRLPGYRYEKDFGGVFYIFIRGVDPALGPQFGVFTDCPDRELVHALGRAMIPGYEYGDLDRRDARLRSLRGA